MMQDEQSNLYATAELIPAMDVYQKIRPLALGGVKIPHGISNPVLRKQDNKICIAFFVYTYTRGDLQNGAIRRPTSWITTDLVTGEIRDRIQCADEDFSDASFTEYFSTNNPNAGKSTKEYYQSVYALLHSIRKTIIEKDSFPIDAYAEYMRSILEIVPPAYHRFYWELSNV